MTHTLRGLAAFSLIFFTFGCASAPPPKTCAIIGASLGGGGGGVYGAKNDRKHDGDSIMGYGALGIVVGGGLGYLACSVLHQEEAEVAMEEAPPAPAPTMAQAEPAPAPAPAPVPEPMAEPDPCASQISFQGVNFEFDKAGIRPEGAEILNGVAQRLGECPDVQVGIIGHTDSVGSEAYNQGLSERRARSVLDYLIGRNLQSTRFSASGQGENSPVAANDTKEGRAMNRRVDLQPSR